MRVLVRLAGERVTLAEENSLDLNILGTAKVVVNGTFCQLSISLVSPSEALM